MPTRCAGSRKIGRKATENSASRQQLRQYLVDLAAIKEQEFKVMDEEAQRCRESISKLPSAAQPKKKSGKQ